MAHSKYLTTSEQSIIVVMRKVGCSLNKILAEFGRPKSTISKVIKRFSEHGEVKIAKKSKRPKKLNKCSRRVLVHEMKRNYRGPLSTLAENLPIPVSIRTLCKELHNLGMNNCIAVKKPFLSPKYKENRLAFAKRHLHWTFHNESQVMWTNE